MFPLHGLSFGLWLQVVGPTLILGEETFKKTGYRSASKSTMFARDLTSLVYAFHQVYQKPWDPPSGNLQHAKFVVLNVLHSFSGDAYSCISYLINS